LAAEPVVSTRLLLALAVGLLVLLVVALVIAWLVVHQTPLTPVPVASASQA
jgi:hypothetical protein